MTSGATPSVWPRVDALRDTGLLLAGLVLVAALADGDLVKWLSGALFVIYALWGVSQDSSATQDVPLSWILIPLFIAIAIAIVVADGDWFYVAIVALATPGGLFLARHRRCGASDQSLASALDGIAAHATTTSAASSTDLDFDDISFLPNVGLFMPTQNWVDRTATDRVRRLLTPRTPDHLAPGAAALAGNDGPARHG